jgi:hypothetical protein
MRKVFKQNAPKTEMREKRGFFNSKKAQGLSVNAIILIILGLVVLVALIIGFTFGFQGLRDRFATSNVATIVSACQTACATNTQYDFCTSPRDLKADEGVRINDATCFYLAQNRTEFGIEKCATITCSSAVLLSDNAGGLLGLKKYPTGQAGLEADRSNVCSKSVSGVGGLDKFNTEGKTVYGITGDEKISTLLSITCKVTQ